MVSARLARLALALYPLAYRRRYGEEMEALVEDQGASPRAVADLARGALSAHLRPEPALANAVGRDDRIRLGLSAVLFCWLLASAAIFAFVKTTEGPAFRAAATAHPLLGAADTALGAFASLASVAFLLGAAPLVAIALAQSRGRREVRSAVFFAVGCVAVLVLATAVVVFVANQDPAPSEGVISAVLVAWVAVGMACALGCARAARRGLFAAAMPTGVLRFAASCATAVTVAMAAIALAALLYLVALVAAATDLAGTPNGPFGNPDTRLSLLLVVFAMTAAAIPAALAVGRTWRAARVG